MKHIIISALMISLTTLLNSCSSNKEEKEEGSLTKRTAKFITKKTIEAAEGISDALKEDGEKLGESVAQASGEVVSGTANGLSDVADEKGNKIGRDLGNATAKTLTGYARGLEDNLEDTKLIIPSSSSEEAIILSVTKIMFQADSINTYVLFKSKGTYELTLRLRNENNQIVGEAYETVEIDREKPTYLSINFGYGNSEPVRQAASMELDVDKK